MVTKLIFAAVFSGRTNQAKMWSYVGVANINRIVVASDLGRHDQGWVKISKKLVLND